MTVLVNVILPIVIIVCFVVTVLFVPFGIYEQIMGPADAQKLLKKMHIPLNYNQVLVIYFVCLALMMVGYFVISSFDLPLEAI